MIESIVVMCLFILLMIVGSWLLPPPKLPTPWMDGNLYIRMVGDRHPAGLLIGFLSGTSLSQRAKKLSHFINHLG